MPRRRDVIAGRSRTGLFGCASSSCLRCLLLVVLCCGAPPASTQEARIGFDRLSIEQGLSQSIIEQIVQDQQGFLWFITEDGLNRFDGYRFSVYKNVAGNPNSLSHNELKAISEDHNGVLWVGCFSGGLNRFDPATEQVVRYRHRPGDDTSIASDTVRALLEDSRGRLWIGTQGGGLDRLECHGGGSCETATFVHHRSDNHPSSSGRPGSLSHDDVRAIIEDRTGRLWIGTYGGGLDQLDPATGQVLRSYHHRPEHADDPAGLGDNRVMALLEDSRGRLWVGTYGGGLDLLDPINRRLTGHYRADPERAGALSSNLVKALWEDHTGTVWVGTDGGGLCRYNEDQGSFTCLRHDPLDPRSLSTDRVYALYQDRSRVLWVGTYGGGLCKADISRKRFRHYRHDPGNPASLGHNIVWSFAEDRDGSLWIGTDSGGLDHFDRDRRRWTHYRHDPDDAHSLAHDTVRSLLVDRDGQLWVATNGGGLDRFDRASGRFVHHRHRPGDDSCLSHDQLRSVSQGSSGALWISTFGGGLDRFDPRSGQWRHFRHDPDDPNSLSNDFVRMVLEDSTANLLWVGTQGGGLNRLELDTGRVTRFQHDPDDPESLSNNHAFALLEGRDGSFWVGTFGGGLDRLDRQTGQCRHFTTDQGLASSSIFAVLEDDQGRLWISTTRGLSRFDPADESFRSFDVRDGLQSNEFNGGAALHCADGEMLFGGINGFNAFYPEEIGINPVVPAVVITDLQLFNRSISVGETVGKRVLLTRPITATGSIELGYRDTVLSLEFAALHYSVPEKNRYRYRLLGFDDTWIPVSAGRRYATYTGLSPGQYHFQVMGANSDGVWNEQPATLDISVRPPFWGTWWFRLLALALVGWLISLGLRNRLQRLRMRTKLRAAHDAQMAIMPQHDPELPGFDISGVCFPADEVGGDFFDYISLDGALPGADGTATTETTEAARLCLVVGDVAGKAMRAAMTAVMSDGMVLSQVQPAVPVEQTMTSLNRSLYHKVAERMFTAMCCLVLDPATRTLTFSNAGLCEPLHRSATATELLASPGPRFPLGAVKGTRYESRALSLAPGDVVMVYSDGVPETRDQSGELYGYERLRQLLARLDLPHLSARRIIDLVVNDVRRFGGSSHQGDDMVLVVIKVDSDPS